MSYRPRSDSLADRVCTYFLRNPEEVLSVEDIALKFDLAERKNVINNLAAAVTAEALTLQKNSRGVKVYSAGPKLAEMTAEPAADQPSQAPTPFKAWLTNKGQGWAGSGGGSGALDMPTPDSLVIERGVPIPSIRPRQSVYLPVMASMEVGDSVLLATPAAKRIVHTAQAWGKACGRKYITRQINATQSRIWRTE